MNNKPRSNNSIRVTIRFKKYKYHQIKRKAQQSHMTLSHYVRRRLNNAPCNPKSEQIYNKSIQEYHQSILANHNLIHQLVSIGNNLNQATRSMNYEIKIGKPIKATNLFNAITKTRNQLVALATQIGGK